MPPPMMAILKGCSDLDPMFVVYSRFYLYRSFFFFFFFFFFKLRSSTVRCYLNPNLVSREDMAKVGAARIRDEAEGTSRETGKLAGTQVRRNRVNARGDMHDVS